MCVSVCVSVRHHESCHYAQRSVQPKVPTASAQAGKHFKYGVFSKNALFKSYGVKMPTSLVCTYRDIIWRRWSDISPEISKTRPFLVLSKSNGRLQATWQSKAASYYSLSAVQACTGCFCSLLRYMFVNACAFSEPRARATAPRRGFAL